MKIKLKKVIVLLVVSVVLMGSMIAFGDNQLPDLKSCSFNPGPPFQLFIK